MPQSLNTLCALAATTLLRRTARRLLEPAVGSTRRIPFGPGRGLRLEGDPWPSLDLWVGLFESELAPYVRRFCAPATPCVDVGGYNGYYALVFALLARAPVRTYDDDEAARTRTLNNLALNPAAGSHVEFRSARVAGRTRPALDEVSLDDDLATWPAVGLLKIDVEGSEADVLRGATGILRDQRPNLIVETHASELERECGDILLSHGYTPVVVTPRRWLPQNRAAQHNRWLVAERPGR